MDWDLQAAEQARSRALEPTAQALCGECSRPIYQDAPFPGVPSEWKHRSSNSAISWSPEKHIASLTSVKPHSHRFVPIAEDRQQCTIVGCDSEVMAIPDRAQNVAAERLSERERRLRESRARGSRLSRQPAPGGPRF